MIVRDEAASIASVIASALPAIDFALILDTGSTDGTVDLAHEALRNLPHLLLQEDFTDFAETRNRALAALGTRATWALTLDADEYLEGAADLRRWAAGVGEEHGAHHVRILFGGDAYDSPRLLRTAAGWRWVGEVHELPMGPGGELPGARPGGVAIRHEGTSDPARQRRRWRDMDVPLLRRAVAARPEDGRALFYLAQTWHCLGSYQTALRLYEQRVAMGGWHEERYEAAYRAALCAELANHAWPEVQQLYLDAWVLARHRAEPLVRIALRYYQQQAWALCYHFAAVACALPYPEADRLFVRAIDYHFVRWDLLAIAGWYLGEWRVGEAAARQALAGAPPADRERCQANLQLYLDPSAA